MATAETQIRVNSESAAALGALRDRYGFASVAVVVAQLLELYEDDFVRRYSEARKPADDRPT